jgi:hypothetical protein
MRAAEKQCRSQKQHIGAVCFHNFDTTRSHRGVHKNKTPGKRWLDSLAEG